MQTTTEPALRIRSVPVARSVATSGSSTCATT